MSQLDLALVACVSTKHLSFLETGRSSPSREMTLRLAAALDLPPHARNALLEAAGFAASFTGPAGRPLEPAIAEALDRMSEQHEPYPFVVMSPRFDVLRTNMGAARLVAALVDDVPMPLNLLTLLFSDVGRRIVVDWETVARQTLANAYGEALRRPDDPSFAAWVRALASSTGIEAGGTADEGGLPAFAVRFRRGPLEVGFYATLTVFNTPWSVGAENLRIESWYPLDDATREACARLAGG